MAAKVSTPKSGRYLLDTNIVTALFKDDAAVHRELAAAAEVLLVSTVLGELYYGAARSGQPRRHVERLEEFAATCTVLGTDSHTARVAGPVSAEGRRMRWKRVTVADKAMTRKSLCTGVWLSLLWSVGAGGPVLAASDGTPDGAGAGHDGGAICIAPFHQKRTTLGSPAVFGPNMSETTWEPSWDSVFTFRVDKRLKATARNDEMVLISEVPVKKRVKVEVRLGAKPFETFWLDLQRAPNHRICLWLYPGYWHWVDQGWNPKLGCKCEMAGTRRAP